MSTDKSGRKRLVGKLATGIILVLVMVYATVFSDFLPNIEQNNEEIETSTSELSEEQNLEGELLLTMIDQTTPNMIQRLNDIIERKPLISIGI